MNNLINQFLDYMQTIKGKSEKTVKGYKSDLTLFENFMLSKNKTEVSDVKLADLYAFLKYCEITRRNSAYAKSRKVACLKSFFKYLHTKARVITENPTLELESPKLSKRNPVYMTLEECKELFMCMDLNDRNHARDFCILTLFLNCGLRISELCSIDVSKIKGDTMAVIGKGNKERTIYLNDACLDAIAKYMPKRKHDIDPLFQSEKKGRLGTRQVERLVKKYVSDANLNKKFTPHKLRHTAATLMYKHGKVDIRSLQEILGHENVSTTQIYTHVDSEDLRSAVSANPLNITSKTKTLGN